MSGWLEEVTQAILFAFTGLLAVAAIGDWRRLLIPNWIPLAVLALYPPFALSSNLLGPPSAAVPWLASLGVAAVVFAVLAGLFTLNKIGGGDVKLISAVSLWAGPGLIAGFLIVTSLAGGLLALVTLLGARLASNGRNCEGAGEASEPGAGQNAGGHRENAKESPLSIPYGVAIACGGFFISGKHIINHFSQ